MNDASELAACKQRIETLEAENAHLRQALEAMHRPSFNRSFDEAFATARRLGLSAFTWRGAEYHTRTREEEEAAGAFQPKGLH